MKKYFYFIFFLLLFAPISVSAASNNRLYKVKKEEMTVLDLNYLVSYDRSYKASAAQGIIVTKNYIFISQSMNLDVDMPNTILVIDRNTLELRRTISLDIGHGNDITYNKKTNEIMFLKDSDGVSIVCIDADTLFTTRTIKLNFINNAYQLAYDNIHNKYYIGSIDGICYVLNSNFIIERSFDIKVNQTIQSFELYDGYIYYSNYETGRISKYQSIYDEVVSPGDSIIHAFNLNGEYIKTFIIPEYNYSSLELEGISIIDGYVYFLFNNWSSSTIDIYKCNYTDSLLIRDKLNFNYFSRNITKYFNNRKYSIDSYNDYSFIVIVLSFFFIIFILIDIKKVKL